ncbi:MAG: hypothetical protein AAF648_09935 [Pseudomonadota bacterium]
MFKTSRNSLLLVLFASVTLLSSVAHAKCSATACTGKVKRLYQYADRDLLVTMEGDQRQLNCTLISKVYQKLDHKAPRFKEIHAMLLAAYLAGRPITVRAKSGGECEVAYVVLDG